MADDMTMDPSLEETPEGEGGQEKAPQPKVQAPPPLPSRWESTFSFLSYWDRRSEFGLLTHIVAWFSLLNQLLLAGTLAWSYFRHPQPLFIGVSLLGLAICYGYAISDRFSFKNADETSMTVFHIFAILAQAGLGALFVLLAVLGFFNVIKADHGWFRVLTFSTVLAFFSLLALAYLLRLIFDWKRASSAIWLMAGFVCQVLAMALFVQFFVVPSALVSILGLILIAYSLSRGSADFAPSFTRTLVLAALLLGLPLDAFLLLEWNSPKQIFNGVTCLDRDPRNLAGDSMNALRWAPAEGNEDPTQSDLSGHMSYTYTRGGESYISLYHHGSEDSMPLPAGKAARGFWWSPDASRVAFFNLEEKKERGQLWTIHLRKGTLQPVKDAVATGEVIMPKSILVDDADVAPSQHDQVWSRDSRYLLYAARKNGVSQVWRADTKRAQTVPVTSGQSHLEPAWSPDGKTILYLARLEHPKRFQIQQDGGAWDDLDLTSHAGDFPAWSLNQRTVLFIKDGKLWSMNSNGTGQELMTDAVPGDGAFLSHAKKPLRLRFYVPADTWHLMSQPAMGGRARELFSAPASKIHHPLWSPDSSQITFVLKLGDESTVYLLDQAGARPLKVFSTKDEVSQLQWSPRGDRFAFRVSAPEEEGVGDRLWTSRGDGLEVEELYAAKGVIMGYNWAPSSMSIAIEEKSRFWPIFRDLYHTGIYNLAERQYRQVMPFRLLSRSPAFSPNGTLLAFVSWRHRWLPSNHMALWVVRVE